MFYYLSSENITEVLPSDEVERQPEEGDHPQQVGPDISRLSVNAKDRLETFPARRKCSHKC